MSAAIWPTASTRIAALLGWPARYSLSPAIHNAAFRHAGLDLAYVVLPCEPTDLELVVRALRAFGAVGANVTVPHKTAVVACCDELTDEARLIGAVNTLVIVDGDVLGDNTDARGVADDWQDSLPARATEEIVVLGTGGAARAVAIAAGRRSARVTVVGRRRDAAAQLASLAEASGAVASDSVTLDDDLSEVVRRATLVVNATPLGMDGERLPAPLPDIGPGQVAHDLVYRPARTPFLETAAASGAQVLGGLGMLTRQAAHSFERWTGRQAPLDVMREAARAALAGG